MLAVADGTVVFTQDGEPEQTPGVVRLAEKQSQIGGNKVILKIAPKVFAAYEHLQPGSLTVKVGDVVQFDWDDSGDRDHTGVVTSVVTERDGSIEIRYAGHTDATLDRSVDWAITEYHPGGVAYYWSIPE